MVQIQIKISVSLKSFKQNSTYIAYKQWYIQVFLEDVTTSAVFCTPRHEQELEEMLNDISHVSQIYPWSQNITSSQNSFLHSIHFLTSFFFTDNILLPDRTQNAAIGFIKNIFPIHIHYWQSDSNKHIMCQLCDLMNCTQVPKSLILGIFISFNQLN